MVRRTPPATALPHTTRRRTRPHMALPHTQRITRPHTARHTTPAMARTILLRIILHPMAATIPLLTWMAPRSRPVRFGGGAGRMRSR